eukprot:4952740-Prymnesium_polylepis.1
MELLHVTCADSLDRWADEVVLPIVVHAHDALEQHVPGARRLLGELARAREDTLDVSGGRLEARDLSQIHSVVHRQHLPVVDPELAQVELVALVVLVLDALCTARAGRDRSPPHTRAHTVRSHSTHLGEDLQAEHLELVDLILHDHVDERRVLVGGLETRIGDAMLHGDSPEQVLATLRGGAHCSSRSSSRRRHRRRHTHSRRVGPKDRRGAGGRRGRAVQADGLAADGALVQPEHGLVLARLAGHLRRICGRVDRRVHLEREQHMVAGGAVEGEACGQLAGKLLAEGLEHRLERRRVRLLPHLRVAAAGYELHPVVHRLVACGGEQQVVEPQVNPLAILLGDALAHKRHLARTIEETLVDVVAAEVGGRQAAMGERKLLARHTRPLLQIIAAVRAVLVAIGVVTQHHRLCRAGCLLVADTILLSRQCDAHLRTRAAGDVGHGPEAEPARLVLRLGRQGLVRLQVWVGLQLLVLQRLVGDDGTMEAGGLLARTPDKLPQLRVLARRARQAARDEHSAGDVVRRADGHVLQVDFVGFLVVGGAVLGRQADGAVETPLLQHALLPARQDSSCMPRRLEALKCEER